ncbi:MAG: DUF4351 domain-containing protein, partial [Rhodocyclaceae bacterium]|nr:DUF4351 domain-containing protein [Rhodocyclaceae bacterium]
FEHWQEESKMATITYAPVQDALDRLKDISADAETRRLAFVRERAMRDENSERRAEREQGMLEGMLEGILKGKLEGKLEGESMLLERLIARRFGPIADATRDRLKAATAEQLENWAERILDASTLAEVFGDH